MSINWGQEVVPLVVRLLSYQKVARRHVIQEAQLSQRDRATLRVIEYFAKSLKVAVE